MGFLAAIPAILGTAAAGVGSAVGGGLSALGGALGVGAAGSAAATVAGAGETLEVAGGAAAGGLSAGTILGGASTALAAGSLGLGIAGALNPPKPPAPMMAPPVSAIAPSPRSSNNSLAALASPSGETNFGAPSTGRVKTLLGQ